MILQLNQHHLKDLKTCFDETTNLKNVLNVVLEKMELISEKTIKNSRQIESLENENNQLKQETVKIRKSIEEVDEELQQ